MEVGTDVSLNVHYAEMNQEVYVRSSGKLADNLEFQVLDVERVEEGEM